MKPRHFAILLSALALFAMSAAPALAWWQFVSYTPNGERKVHTPYANEKICQAALKQVEAELGEEISQALSQRRQLRGISLRLWMTGGVCLRFDQKGSPQPAFVIRSNGIGP